MEKHLTFLEYAFLRKQLLERLSKSPVYINNIAEILDPNPILVTGSVVYAYPKVLNNMFANIVGGWRRDENFGAYQEPFDKVLHELEIPHEVAEKLNRALMRRTLSREKYRLLSPIAASVYRKLRSYGLTHLEVVR